MLRPVNNQMQRLTAGIFTLLFALLALSCAPPPPNGTASPTPAAQATPSASPSTSPEAGQAVITLPMLDALMSDEEFVAKAKTEQKLTDEEVKKLRDEARAAVQDLSEEGDDDVRSTSSAASDALNKLKSILGEQRAAAFIKFVSQQHSNSAETQAGQMNAVPSDTRVVVNIPAYRMDVFKDGELVKTYKIGIGYPEFPIPTGTRTAKAIIFNPTWTPPDEPWVKGKLKPFQKVEAGDKLNPLGPIKIPIGSPSLIHGGKSAARLGTFNSHGCVGLTNGQVQDFAAVISSIAGNEITLGEVKNYEKQKTETKQVPLDKPVTVELRYETIVVENGVLKLYRDVYEHGTNTEANLRTVLEKHGVSLDSMDAAMKQKILDGLKQMSRDAMGNQLDARASANTNTNANPKSTSDKVTRAIKGKKEVSFPIPALAGKGYPAAKNLKAA